MGILANSYHLLSQPVSEFQPVCIGKLLSARTGNFPVTGQVDAVYLGKLLLAYFPVPQNCCRKGKNLFSTCISQKICLDRHTLRFEFLSLNADTALKSSITSSSVNSHWH